MAHITKKQYLFCPGPVNVAENIKQAVVENEIGHREAEFVSLMLRLREKLLKFFEVKNTNAYFPIVITGSGTAANETVFSSLGNPSVLVLTNGEFGNRLFEISKLHNKRTYKLDFDWGRPIEVKKVEAFLKKKKIGVIAMVHHETSIGILNPAAKIGALAKKYKALFVMDAVSSAGAEKIDLEKWHISFCTTSSSKAIGSLPGLSLVIGKTTEFEKLKDVPVKVMYLNLYKFYHYAKTIAQTPNTPAVQLFFAIEQAITNILREGVEKRRKKVSELSTQLRTGLKKMGFQFLIDEASMSNTLTTVKLPEFLDITTLQRYLKSKGIIVYNGKGPFKDKVFQVANIGEVNKLDIMIFLDVMKTLIQTLTLQPALVRKTKKILPYAKAEALLPNKSVNMPQQKGLPFRQLSANKPN